MKMMQAHMSAKKKLHTCDNSKLPQQVVNWSKCEEEGTEWILHIKLKNKGMHGNCAVKRTSY